MNYDVTDCYNVTRLMNEQKLNLHKEEPSNTSEYTEKEKGCNLFDLIRVENSFLSSFVQTFGDTFSKKNTMFCISSSNVFNTQEILDNILHTIYWYCKTIVLIESSFSYFIRNWFT
jgi:hypothetical protein